jgi:PHD/YefM family antitoxin component YafN of YafNO toxin-antitoxin module
MKGISKNLDFKYVTDDLGNKTGVLIGLKDWQIIQNELTEYLKYQELKSSLEEAFQEVYKLQNGEREQVSLATFLNED